jgi:ribosomal protein L11 methyltransferase
MAWIELTFQTTADIAQCLTSLLDVNGALAVTLQDASEQPIYEPELGTEPLWDNVLVTGLYDETSDLKKVIAIIIAQFPLIKYTLKTLEDQEWERLWMQDFIPMQFGQRLWIIPSYQTHEPSKYHVMLDPGLAFGTGKHPTTALCLKWLDKHIKGQEIIMDYGCGSGILGIAAIKLGAKKVFAVDHDPQAMTATIENAKKNGLTTEQIETVYPQELTSKQQADVLVANIVANPLIELAEHFANHLTANGNIVLSGILRQQTDAIIEAYQPWFDITTIENQEDWVRIDGRKRF